MKVKGKHSESLPMYITFLAVGAVAAAASFFIILNVLGGGFSLTTKEPETTAVTEEAPEQPGDSASAVDEAATEEMKDAAIQLIANNYEVLKLYYTKGLDHIDEPYGNVPEDNYLDVDSDKYTKISQLNELVNSTYTADTAKTVKKNPLGYGAIYKKRDSGKLGIIYGFTPMSYDISWDNPVFKISGVQEDSCTLKVTVHSKTTSEEIELEGQMIKTEDGWRLESVIY